ncbi:hypothetical protein BX285_6757 [Streptomyces sp. 1114.5]|uniref:hypothetical protein n=1 Tax=unclassified Streptomyces TaxID=2593676 RepID=UPI000BDA486A|nr:MULTISPECIES: hypothetical protein [unclassified Streptomyces]RKT09656.1 hypothetical protein BX285_6757 [Streptomyces sp. 1114.5]SOB89009.1 hypothetical protein SAMN06272789_7338 [Streptomyces sp. 1331.2]
MRTPGFTAEQSLDAAAPRYRAAAAGGVREPGGVEPSRVRPAGLNIRCGTRRRAGAVRRDFAEVMTVTCEPGSSSVCEDYCAHAGGGMSSNPDGSTTCTVM